MRRHLSTQMAQRRRDLAQLLRMLRSFRRNSLSRDQLMARLNAAKAEAGSVFEFVNVGLPLAGQPVTRETFTFGLDKPRLRNAEFQEKLAS
jgi:hypothetical protein